MDPRLQVGIEYNPGADEVGFIGNLTIAEETETHPHASLGTSSDRIGTPEGFQCYYMTIAKSFPSTGLGAYVSFNYSEFEDGVNFPFGVSYDIRPDLRALFMNDGRKSHGLLTYQDETWSVSLLWVWFRHAGISFSWGF